MSDELEVFEGEVLPAVVKSDRRYPLEELSEDEDDGTIVENVEELEKNIVGSRIVKCEKRRESDQYRYAGLYTRGGEYFVITLDSGVEVQLFDGGDCCAYTNLDAFLLDPSKVDHIITGVGTTDGYQTWHIYCDYGDVLKLDVGWSCGNPFYYGYGFDIKVVINVDGNPELPAAQKAIEA